MRVAYVVSTLDRCGPVNVLYDIIKFLPPSVKAAVFTMAQEPPTSRLGDFESLGITVVQACPGRVSSMFAGKVLLGRALAKFNPDIVHLHGFRPYLACEGLDVPVVATVHNCIYEDYLTTYGEKRAAWMTRKEVAALKSFEVIVACSESNADYLRNEYNLKPVVVRNGVDQSRFLPLAATPRSELRAALGLRPEATVLVATGGCSERKRTLPLVEAFSSARRVCGADVELHVFGEGPQYEQCKGLEVAGVVFHGFVDDVVPWLQASDLFVSASASEGMPLAVLEAISCGLPALLSDIPPHKEICKALGDAARCFKGASPDVMADDLESALGKLQTQRMSDASVFSSAAMSANYVKTYERLMQ